MITRDREYDGRIERVAHLLGRTLQKRGLFEAASAALTVERARRWLADRDSSLLQMLQPVRVEDGVLVVTARHAVALQEGQGLLPELLEALRRDLGPAAPKTARLVRE